MNKEIRDYQESICGFFKYHGMNAEQFLWAVIKSEVLYPKRLLYQTENLYLSCMEETILAGEKSGRNGAQIMEKKYRKREKVAKRKKGRRGAVD